MVAKRIWPSQPARIGSVVAYRAVGDLRVDGIGEVGVLVSVFSALPTTAILVGHSLRQHFGRKPSVFRTLPQLEKPIANN